MKTVISAVFIFSLNLYVIAVDLSDFHLACGLLTEQRYEEAGEIYRKFIDGNPDALLVSAAKWNLASLEMEINKDYYQASQLFKSIIQDSCNVSWQIYSYEALGQCHEILKNWQEAAECYQQLFLKMQGTSVEYFAEQRMGEIKRRLFNCYQQMNNTQSMIEMYHAFIEENPLSTEDYVGLASAYLSVKDLKSAVTHFMRVVEYFPASQQASFIHQNYKELLTSEAKYDWHLFEKFQSGLNSSRGGNYKQASSDFEEVLNAKHSLLAHAVNIQILILEFRQNGDANLLHKRLGNIPDKNLRGYGGERIDFWDNTLRRIDDSKRLLQNDSTQFDALFNLGYRYYLTAAYGPSVSYLEKAKSVSPETARVYNMLGYAYLGLNNFNEAKKNFTIQIEVDPTNANSYDSMAEFYYHIGDTSAAIKHYSKACEIDSSFANAYYMLGRIYQEIDQSEKALIHLKKFIQLAPSDVNIPDAQRRLTELDMSINKN